MGFFEKRGQLTSFILVGIILFIILAVAFYFISFNSTKKEADIASQIPFKVEELEQRVDSCLAQLVRGAIEDFAVNGGYLNIMGAPTEPLNFSIVEGYRSLAAVWFLGGNSYIVKEEGLEFQFDYHLEENIPKCVKFDKLFVREVGDINAKVNVELDYVDVELTYPFVIQKDQTIIRAKDKYYLKHKSSLGSLRKLAEEIVLQQKAYNGSISLSDLDSKGFNIKVIPVSSDASVFFILQDGLIFRFGSKKNEN